MINTILGKLTIIGAVMLLSLTAFYALTPATVFAQTAKDEACDALAQLDDTVNCTTGDAEGSVVGIAKTVINVLSLIVGIVSVIVIIISGFRFVTSGGEAQQVQGARNGIIYAIVGLIVVILAQAIVAFVLNRV